MRYVLRTHPREMPNRIFMVMGRGDAVESGVKVVYVKNYGHE